MKGNVNISYCLEDLLIRFFHSPHIQTENLLPSYFRVYLSLLIFHAFLYFHLSVTQTLCLSISIFPQLSIFMMRLSISCKNESTFAGGERTAGLPGQSLLPLCHVIFPHHWTFIARSSFIQISIIHTFSNIISPWTMKMVHISEP